ncbi:MAG: formylmethanofuran dehydrogenase subunit E family protein [Candidatus Nezhaarchaeota archaeon]|nr:formylmethanofuran dehydrogenase subunit E family protein [Candidatus Nezhaarchaeota archaeon]
MNWGLSLEEAIRFHGHLGPWLVIGYRCGELARRILKPNDHHDLICIIKIPAKTPFACSIDGVQASTSCTAGKMNIRVEESDDFEYIFTKHSSGETIKLKVRKEIVDKLTSTLSLEEAAKKIMELDLWSLFELS